MRAFRSRTPALGLAATVVGGVWLARTGPFPVLVGSEPIDALAPFWYMLTPFPVLGLLAAEVLDRARPPRRGFATTALLLAVVVGLSHLRLTLGLPLSGHALLFAYAVARSGALKSAPPALRWAAVVSGITLVPTVFMKLAVWGDPTTLWVGGLIGIGLGLAPLLLPGSPEDDAP